MMMQNMRPQHPPSGDSMAPPVMQLIDPMTNVDQSVNSALQSTLQTSQMVRVTCTHAHAHTLLMEPTAIVVHHGGPRATKTTPIAVSHARPARRLDSVRKSTDCAAPTADNICMQISHRARA
jgi:hypothetical protein